MLIHGKSSAQETVEEWLDARPSWLRTAAQGLVDNRRLPSEHEIEALATHCAEEAAGRLAAAHPSLLAGSILGAPAGPDIRLDKIAEISGVNALGKQALLDLSKADLTVIYGANGSGKSGYARLIKHICGARAREEIHGNVFQDGSETAKAVVHIRSQASGQKPSSPTVQKVAWSAADGPLAMLRAVHVFDTPTAIQLGQSPNTASHLPRLMRFVGALIDLSDRVQAKLKLKAHNLVSLFPPIPAELEQTGASKFIGALTADQTKESIDTACQFTEQQRLERVALEAALAQADPAAAHAKVVSELERVKKLGQEMAAWASRFDAPNAAKVVSARIDAVTKRAAAKAYASDFFEGMPLSGVGENTWRKLWDAAMQYAQECAYPGHSHPNTDDQERCVLCQQPLDDDAKSRMKSFADYVSNRLEAEATSSERILAELITSLPEPPIMEHWQAYGASIALDEPAVVALSTRVAERLKMLKVAEDISTVPTISWTAWQTALDKRIAALGEEHDALASLIDPAGRLQKQAQLKELKGAEWLAKHRQHVEQEVELLKQKMVIKSAIRLTNTAALTSMSNDIAEKELALGYCERFNEELKRLCGGTIPVEMDHRREGKGKFTFLVQLRGSKAEIRCRDVLSEGEQRVVALAAFLADVSGSDRALPVIFDDPISSLDQRYEEAVANRLVALAEDHQVIAFTHRLSLMVLLENAAEKRAELALSPVQVNVASISRHGADTGMPASINVFSMKPKSGFNELKNRIGAARKFDPTLQQIAIKDTCSNFRILVERTVEDHLCSKVVVRFRREITTINRLRRLAAIDPNDCATINDMMTKYSAFEHSQSVETPSWLPEPDELLSDIDTMLAWIDDFESRAKAA